MNRFDKVVWYLFQPIPWPVWIICALSHHTWGPWEDVMPGSKRRRRQSTCRRCDTSMFLLPGQGLLKPTWRALLQQWLCALRPGGHAWPVWARMRRQTDVTRSVHRITYGRQCPNCERFEKQTVERTL